jgi:hypothetical protein
LIAKEDSSGRHPKVTRLNNESGVKETRKVWTEQISGSSKHAQIPKKRLALSDGC